MARDRDRDRRDIAGVGPDPQLTGRLSRLSATGNYRIADGEPDIRGWEVCTLAGSDIGEVDDLLIDPHRGEVVMLDIDLKGTDEHVNVPIRGVQLDRGRKCVIVDSGDVRSAREQFAEDDDVRLRRDARDADIRAADDGAVESAREVRYGRMADDGDTEEVVVERRPVIEEVVVRRRVGESEDIDEEEP
jgi:sporulation protein YlmC with PRC-barrel domain